MAIAQSDFTLFRGNAYEGQVSTIELADIDSKKVETGMVQFGRAVIRGAGPRSCAPVTTTTTAAQIAGFSVRSLAEFSPSAPTNPPNYATGYDVSHIASVMHRGRMFALCVDGATAGQSVSVILTAGDNQGRLTAGTGDGLLVLNQVRWVDAVTAGKIGEIRVDGIFNV
ncbi:structural cement protein Gp24 [Dickeya undicola]|uniref:structural cement protein Gp24 n=1 Tax=Dickeya undicola TaxID=1577887 RepID=UPI003F221BC9